MGRAVGNAGGSRRSGNARPGGGALMLTLKACGTQPIGCRPARCSLPSTALLSRPINGAAVWEVHVLLSRKPLGRLALTWELRLLQRLWARSSAFTVAPSNTAWVPG